MQQKLDDEILLRLNAELKEAGYINEVVASNLKTERLMALACEVMELANALKSDGFKYWTNKKSEPKERLLDEYVDIFHFWLSVGLALGFTPDEVEKAYKVKNAVNFQRQEEGY
jgi:dimeric dUTPase (all-alpha-NTP-PPase superfamily)